MRRTCLPRARSPKIAMLPATPAGPPPHPRAQTATRPANTAPRGPPLSHTGAAGLVGGTPPRPPPQLDPVEGGPPPRALLPRPPPHWETLPAAFHGYPSGDVEG